MLSYSWGMTSNKCGCEAQTPSLVPPIEASPLLIYSHFGRPNGGVGRPSPNETNSQQKQSGSEGGQDQLCSMPSPPVGQGGAAARAGRWRGRGGLDSSSRG